MKAESFLAQTRGQLIVSCQALPDEPLHGADTMAKLARAAKIGGAAAIRANSPADIRAIKAAVDLPVIGPWKQGDSGVFITPTFDTARAVAAAGADIIALDCTRRPRPDGVPVDDLLARIQAELRLPIFADAANMQDALLAEAAGVDMGAWAVCVGSAITRPRTIAARFARALA